MKVSTIMNKNVITVTGDTKIKDVARVLIRYGFTGVPVVKKQEVIGIVTEADLIMQKAKIHIPKYIQLLDSYLYLENPAQVEEELHKILGLTAEEIMTKDVVTIQSDAPVEELATLIKEKHINPVPVVKGRRLVGIVSRADIVRLLAR